MGSLLATCIDHDAGTSSANFTANQGLLHQSVKEAVEAGLADPGKPKNQYLESSTRAVVQAFCINLLLLIGQLVAFSVLMKSKHMAKVLAPRWKSTRAPAMLFGWAWKAYQETHPKVSHGHMKRLLYHRLNNLDGAVMVRFCVLGFKFTATGSVFCLFLVPYYMAGPGGAPESTFNRFNLRNLGGPDPDGDRSNRFLAVVIAAYLMTGLFVHFTLEEWKNFVEMRRAHFARLAGVNAARGEEKPVRGAAQALRSVVIERVPPFDRALDGSKVCEHFEGLFPAADCNGVRTSRVHSCVVQAETGFLYKRPEALLASAGRSTLNRFRSALRERLQDGHELPDEVEMDEIVSDDLASMQVTKSESEDSAGSPADLGLGEQAWMTMAGLRQRAREVTRLVNTVVVGSWNAGDQSTGSSTAFLTFYSIADRVAAEQMVLDSDLVHWQAFRAPEACDIVWPNAALPIAKVHVATACVSAFLVVLLLFWSTAVASLQFYTSELTPVLLHGLADFGVLGKQLYSFLASYLPVLALIGLQCLLPAVFDFLARNIEGIKTSSQIQRRVLRTYFQFQMATLYVTVFSGSLLSGLCEVLQKPTNVFFILQNKVPSVATYFINYVMARAGLSTPMLLLFSMLTLPGCGGEAEEKDSPPPVRPNYAMEASNLGMVLVLGLTYSCVAPLIMPVCMVFFLLSGLVYRWLFLYVYTPEFSCDGGIWYELFNGSMNGLLLGTLSLAASVAVYCGFESLEFWAALLLVILVVVAHRLFQVYYGEPSQFISLEDAREMDRACQGVIGEWLSDDYYIDPVIKSSPKDVTQVASTVGATMGCCCSCSGRPCAWDEENEDSDGSDSDSEDESSPFLADEASCSRSRSRSDGVLLARQEGLPPSKCSASSV